MSRTLLKEVNMLKPHKIGLITLAAGAVLGTGIAVRTAVARENVTPPPDPVALGEQAATQLVLLMDSDKNGMVSRDEYMRFMAAEFNRLDKDKSGELDVRELRHSQLRPAHLESFTAAGK
jgi:hypothetical protein